MIPSCESGLGPYATYINKANDFGYNEVKLGPEVFLKTGNHCINKYKSYTFSLMPHRATISIGSPAMSSMSVLAPAVKR